ncbi:MAG TPA: YaaR family protein [Clostridiales bacterium]|nr:YaaR family protein [Clostridiales bacterium]
MRIKDIGSRAGELPIMQGGSVNSSKLGRTRQKTFQDALYDSHQEALKEELFDLLYEIEEQGKILSSRLTLAELLRYKKLITNFLDKAVSNMYTTLRHNHFDSNGGYNIHCIVKKIDKKLEKLTEEVLDEQHDHITVMGYIDDIKGLLMDIVT